jgi:hypothetical protein
VSTARGTREFIARHRNDIIAASVVGVATFLLAFSGALRIAPAAFENRNFDVYFQGDLPRTYQEMVTRFSTAARSGIHLLYPLAVHPVTFVVHAVLHLSWLDAVRSVVALIAAGWAVSVFVCGRLLGIRVMDSTLMTAVGIAGAAARFWLVVPETFVIGGVALLTAIAIAAYADRRPLSDTWYVTAGVATFGSTLTNWTSGILLALTTGSLRRAVRISLQVVGATALLWIAERLVFPKVVFIFDPLGVRQYFYAIDPSRFADVTRAFFLHVAVAPQVEACRNMSHWGAPFFLSFQGSGVASGGSVSAVATLVWLAMLVLGTHTLIRSRSDSKARLVLGGTLIFQYGLHLLYGGETFLYSIHWWGLLVIVVALGLRTKAAWAIRLLAVAFILTAGIHNVRSWDSTLSTFQSGVSGYPVSRYCEG